MMANGHQIKSDTRQAIIIDMPRARQAIAPTVWAGPDRPGSGSRVERLSIEERSREQSSL